MEIHAKYTLFAEGARGHLTKRLKAQFDLEADCQPQVYGLGHQGTVGHRSRQARARPGDPHAGLAAVARATRWGGGFLYHQANGQVALGFVTALDYRNPYV